MSAGCCDIEALVVSVRRVGEFADATIDVNANPVLPKVEVWIDVPTIPTAVANVQLSPNEARRLIDRLNDALALVVPEGEDL